MPSLLTVPNSGLRALHRNLNTLDLSLILNDVMTVADELDSQLVQTAEGSWLNPAAQTPPGFGTQNRLFSREEPRSEGRDGSGVYRCIQ